MARKTKKTEQDTSGSNDEQTSREAQTGTDDRATHPNAGEDPGLLPMNEDPRERRLKRNTM